VLTQIGGLATGRLSTPDEVATLMLMLASPRTEKRDRLDLS